VCFVVELCASRHATSNIKSAHALLFLPPSLSEVSFVATLWIISRQFRLVHYKSKFRW